MESVFAEYRSISAPNQDSLRLDYNSFRDYESQPSLGKWKIMCFQTASFDGNFLLGFRNMIWKSLERTKKFEDNLFKQAFDWESLLIFHALGIPVIFFFASRGFWNWTQTDILMDISSSSDPTHQRDQTLVPVLELEVPPASLPTDTLRDPILGHDVATCTGSL